MKVAIIMGVLSVALTVSVVPSRAISEEPGESGLTKEAENVVLTRIVTGAPLSILKSAVVGAPATKQQLIAALRTVQRLKRGLAAMRVKGEIRQKRTKKEETVQAIAGWLEGVKQAQEQAETMEADLKEMLKQQTEISYEELQEGLKSFGSTVQSLAAAGRELARGR